MTEETHEYLDYFQRLAVIAKNQAEQNNPILGAFESTELGTLCFLKEYPFSSTRKSITLCKIPRACQNCGTRTRDRRLQSASLHNYK